MTGIKKLIPFTALLLLLTIVGCVEDPESFYQNDIAAVEQGEVYLSLETAPDGTGSEITSLTVDCLESQDVYAVLRDTNNGTALASMEVEWSSDQMLSISESISSVAQVIGTSNGETSLIARYGDDEYQLSATLFVNVEGICGLPVTPYGHFIAANTGVAVGEEVTEILGNQVVNTLEMVSSYGAPVLGEEEGNYYLEFSGTQSLKTVENLSIEGNQARTIIAVAMPYKFGEEDDPINPPTLPAASLLGFGIVDGNRSIFDFNLFENGEFITNFYGSTIGYDDSYNNYSPKAELDEVQIFTSRYTNAEHNHYGKHYSYINGEEGNSVWTRLETNPGPLYLGRSVLGNSSISENFQGRIYEVIVYDRELSEDELDEIHQFFLQKYDL